MSQERRATPRARVPGTFVHCEGAAGERIQVDALNLSAGGLFIPTKTPLPAGKRVTLRLQVGGVSAPWWSALGRVIWVRATGTSGAPAGMGVKLLDFEEEGGLEAITQLVAERLRTSVGKVPAAPATLPPAAEDEKERPTLIGETEAVVQRERTILGIGTPAPAPASSSPDPALAPPPPREVTAPIDLRRKVERPPSPEAAPVESPAASEPPESEEPLVAAGVPRKGGAGRVVLLAILVAAGVGAYRFRDRWLPQVRAMLGEAVSAPAAPVSSPPLPAAAPSASASSAASTSASPVMSAPRASAKAAPSTAPSAARPPVRPAPPPVPAPAAKTDDNPY